MTEQCHLLHRNENDAVIDWNALKAFQALGKPGGPDPRVRLINVFLGSSPGLLEKMRAALRASDPESLAKAAHSMKSSSMNMGATGLGLLCAELEKIGRNNTMADAGRLLARAEIQYGAVAAAFRAALSEFES
jgi:HPt (histidine-containing phosphotransfer) domain-containing protein